MKRKWYNNGKTEILVRNIKNVPHGFIEGRIQKKRPLDILKEKISKEYLYELYIIQNIPFDKLYVKLNISRSQLRTLLTSYKIKKNIKDACKNNNYIRPKEICELVAKKSSITQKKKWQNMSKSEYENYCNMQKKSHSTENFKTKISIINKNYRQDLKLKNPEKDKNLNIRRKESCKKKWATDSTIRERRHFTELQNRLNQKSKLCRTIAEQKLYDKLIQLYPDIKYDIKVDNRYPYYCDFYIPSLDIFIELQAHPSHGRLPLDMLSIEEYSLYPNKWVDVFARRDIQKLKQAQQSKISLIRIYPQASLEENIILNNHCNINLIEICYKTQH